MEASKKAIDIIKYYEGLHLDAYLCPAGVLTIGYGHTRGVTEGMEITAAEADRLLNEDLAEVEAEVNKIDGLNQNQFDALVSFVFNLGATAFRRSTLRKMILADRDDPNIAPEFKRWIYGGGQVLRGLVSRRAEEAELYFTA